MIDKAVESVVERCVAGHRLTPEEALPLFSLDAESPEAALIRWAARTITHKASQGRGLIYAQIGLDALPCPVNCDFCTLAAQSTSSDATEAIVPLDDVARYAQIFTDAGVHLISLMATAALPFEMLCETIQHVRQEVGPNMPLMVNYGDISLHQAKQLKAAGANAAYHANRLGEGVITTLDPQERLRTMAHIKEAGLQLLNAVEPVQIDTPHQEILDHMVEALSFKPYCSGVGTLTPAKGTPLEDAKPLGYRKASLYAGIMRLMAGTSVPFGTGGGNVLWVDAGTNPRGRHLPLDPAILEADVKRQRKALTRDGWIVPDAPLALQ